MPLIAASVMSKKLAVTTDLILLDVKAGSGAFMQTADDARTLAEACRALADGAERTCGVAVTDMSQPLGDAVGNALDVLEAIEVLRGVRRGRLRELAGWFAAKALEALEGVAPDVARDRAEEALNDGTALERFQAMIEAQGGDPRVVDDPAAVLPHAPVVAPLFADRSGTLARVQAAEIGLASGALGAGRIRKGDQVDPAVGVVIHPKIGDRLSEGEPIGEIHARTEDDAVEAGRRVLSALELTDGRVDAPDLVHAWWGPEV